MVFDSVYDEFRGAIILHPRDERHGPQGQTGSSSCKRRHRARRARSRPEDAQARPSATSLSTGQVGYLIAGIKSLGNVHIGDTVTLARGAQAEPLPGYEEPKRMVFCGLYPSDGQDFETLREALAKLQVNDPSFVFEPESRPTRSVSASAAVSWACCTWRSCSNGSSRRPTSTSCRRRRTSPTRSRRRTASGSRSTRRRACPTGGDIEEFRQPVVRVSFVAADRVHRRRDEALRRPPRRVPPAPSTSRPRGRCWFTTCALAEVVYDMHDRLKSVTRGYGTMDYELKGYEQGDLVTARHPGQRRPRRRPLASSSATSATATRAAAR